MGSGYVVDHCVSAFLEYSREQSFRAYVTDALKNINHIEATKYGGQYMNERWADIVETRRETKTGDDIVREIVKKAGLQVEGTDHGFDDIKSDPDP